MQNPLDRERLDVLLCDGDGDGRELGPWKISDIKHLFKKRKIAQGIECLLRSFGFVDSYLFFEGEKDERDWEK